MEEERNRQQETQNREEERKKEKRKIILILLLILLLLLTGIVGFLFVRNRNLDGFAPKLDTFAEQMEVSGEKMEVPEGGGAVSLTYSTDVTVILEEKKAEVLFENPSKSTKDAVLELAVCGQNEGEEKEIARSELIPAGYRLSEMSVNQETELETGKYEGVLHVRYYDPQTKKQEVVDTKIPVTITVIQSN